MTYTAAYADWLHQLSPALTPAQISDAIERRTMWDEFLLAVGAA